MIITKLYKYDSTKAEQGYRGEDYSPYILMGDTLTDDLSEVLGTAELTLAGLPTGEEFSPKTKFILEKIDTSRSETDPLIKTWDLIVQNDTVDKAILSDDNFYDHHITFTEPSALAQGYLVDNISVTYKLQDVSLDKEIIYDKNLNADPTYQDTEIDPLSWQSTHKTWFIDNGVTDSPMEYRLGKKLVWDTNYAQDWGTFKYYQEVPNGGTPRSVTLQIPMLRIYNYAHRERLLPLGYCSVITTVTEKNIKTNEINVVASMITNPCRNEQSEAWQYDNEWGVQQYSNRINDKEGRILTKTPYYFISNEPVIFGYDIHTAKVANYDNIVQNRTITFDLKPNCIYTVQTRPKENFIYYSHGYAVNYVVYGYIKNDSPTLYTNNDYPCATLNFMTYLEADSNSMLFKSAPPANAYDLFQKAQISTQNIEKQRGIPINETPQTFYISQADKLMLQNTQIVENFYNQKNFWEILLEIGKYIHAIPKIKFGDSEHSDQFLVTWSKLGLTEQYENSSTTLSIFNSRSMENYVSACSSYVTNMIQMGGEIDEWVAPKSSSEDYLVYNDVAEIHTSKPIIEIVKLDIKCTNPSKYGIPSGQAIKTLTPENETGYVFEENVYNCLGVDYTLKTNKGFAIYYRLGDNKIVGLNYRLPTKNAGDYEGNYAIKNIIGRLYGINQGSGILSYGWTNIEINDFLFHVIYRTKDTVRSEQSRPDLRKYLLNSSYDRTPQHCQFNNQQDVLVDGSKFGNNVYGKLIRTGNTEYTVVDWIDNLYMLKEVGQLYEINGDRYYVVTVKNTFYGTHIISEIKFSKDYNQLSEIIGIPSEPRFYEISEQSLIEREVSLNDYLIVGATPPDTSAPFRDNHFVRPHGWGYINKLLFQNENSFPKYALTIFKNDVDNKSESTYQGNETFFKEVVHPINTYSIQNTLTMEWDMVDNFSAGDAINGTPQVHPLNLCGVYNVETTIAPTNAEVTQWFSTNVGRSPNNNDAIIVNLYPEQYVYIYINGEWARGIPPVDRTYSKLSPVKYTDVYGRSDLIDFVIFKDLGDLDDEWIRLLPSSPVRTRFHKIGAYKGKIVFEDNYSSLNEYYSLFTSFVGGSPRNGDGIMVTLNTQPATWLVYYKDGDWLDYNTDAVWRGVYETKLDDYEIKLIDANVLYDSGTPIPDPEFPEDSLGNQYHILVDNGAINWRTTPVENFADKYLFGNEQLNILGDNETGLGLLKDNREKISLNLNIQMLTASDRFVLSSWLWEPGKGTLKLALFKDEINKISNDTIPNESLITDEFIIYDGTTQNTEVFEYETYGHIVVKIRNLLNSLTDEQMEGVKAIAIVSDNIVADNTNSSVRYFVMGRNVDGLNPSEKKANWYVSNCSKKIFPHQ